MKRFAPNRMMSMVAIALAIGINGAATAATASGTLTMNGTVTYIPPPASCTVGSQTIDASYAIPTGGAFAYTKTANLTVTCTNGTGYSLVSAVQQNPLSVDGAPNKMQVGITNAATSTNIATSPLVGTGNGAAQSFPVTMQFMSFDGTALNSGSVGAISGTVALTVTY